jgi:hypothetical protein
MIRGAGDTFCTRMGMRSSYKLSTEENRCGRVKTCWLN